MSQVLGVLPGRKNYPKMGLILQKGNIEESATKSLWKNCWRLLGVGDVWGAGQGDKERWQSQITCFWTKDIKDMAFLSISEESWEGGA